MPHDSGSGEPVVPGAPWQKRVQTLRDLMLLAALAGAMFFFNLGAPRLWDVDETIFAQTAREMMERGDYVVPYFNGDILTDKPVGTYWAMISAYTMFGPTEFAARFWSALCAIGTVLLVYRLVRLTLDRSAAVWSAVVLATSFNFCVVARAATPDSLLVLLSTLSILILVESMQRGAAGALPLQSVCWSTICPHWGAYAAAYAVMGAGVLVKGPIGFLLPASTIGLFQVCSRLNHRAGARNADGRGAVVLRFCRTAGHALRASVITMWEMRPLTAFAAVAAVAGPWYCMVAARTDGAWLSGFLGVHNVGRFLNPMDNHRGGLWYYPVALIVGLLPWSVLLVPVVGHVRANLRTRSSATPAYLLAVCWLLVYVLFFSLASTKLPSYIVPAYPALALLVGGFVQHWITAPHAVRPRVMRVVWLSLAILGGAAVIGIPRVTSLYLPGEKWLWLVGLLPLAGAVAGFVFSQRGHARRAATALALTAALTVGGLLGEVLVHVDRHQSVTDLATAVGPLGDGPVGSFFFFRPSMVYYSGRRVTKLSTPDAAVDFFRAHTGGAFVLTTGEHMFRLAGKLPADVCILAERPRFLKPGTVVLLGRREPVITARLESVRR